MKTRQEFVEEYRHVLGGMVLDAATSNLHGAELSVRLRMTMRHIDTLLARIYDSEITTQAVNGLTQRKAPAPP